MEWEAQVSADNSEFRVQKPECRIGGAAGTRTATTYSAKRKADHNFPAHSSTHRLPTRWLLPTRRETHLSLQPEVLRSEHRAEDRREERLKQLRVELREQRAVQRGIQVEVEVKVEVEMERKTDVPTQATTRLKILLEVLPDVLRAVLRETLRRARGESAVCRLQWAVPVTTMRYQRRPRREAAVSSAESPASVLNPKSMATHCRTGAVEAKSRAVRGQGGVKKRNPGILHPSVSCPSWLRGFNSGSRARRSMLASGSGFNLRPSAFICDSRQFLVLGSSSGQF